jgi:hypothetical protein
MQEAASYAVFIVMVMVACAILLMVDLSRHAECSQCVHCKQKKFEGAEKQKRLKEEARRLNHRAWHQKTEPTTDCPYCNESSGVPPPTGSTKK